MKNIAKSMASSGTYQENGVNLDILFLGKLFPREAETEIKRNMKTGMQDAANALQWNLIDGFDANHCGTVRILTLLPIDSYPKGYTKAYIQESVFQHSLLYRSDDTVVGCSNFTIIKQFENFYPFRRKVREWCLDGGKRKKVLFCYTASAMFLSLAKYAKKLNPAVETCCMIADIPEFSSARELHGLHRIYNDYETRRTARLYNAVDKFVLLTEQMADRLRLKSPHIVVEGIAPEPTDAAETPIPDMLRDQKYILYTGTLNYEFGIGTLLEAFEKIQNNDVKLVICGFGAAEAEIQKRKDSRIVFLGRVDRTQALALQRRAAVLVNPRQNNAEFTKYSFPSKTMEYLASGVPVVAYKLDGIPDEYDAFIRYVPDQTSETLAAVLSEMCALPQLKRAEIGEKAKQFVLSEKNAEKQARKILDFLQ